MSRPSGNFPPQFNYSVQGPSQTFTTHPVPAPQKSNNVLQPWMQPRPRSAQNMQNTASSMRSKMSSSLHQRPFDNSNFHQDVIAPLNNEPNHDLLGMGLLAPPGHFPSARNTYSPVAQHQSEEPWNTWNSRATGVCDDRIPFDQSNGSMKVFGRGPGSAGSAAPRSDSGYHSQSVVSHDDGRRDQVGMQRSFTHQSDIPNVCLTPSVAPPMLRIPSDLRSQVSRISSRSGNQNDPLKCRECGVISKCNSDHKYVPSVELACNALMIVQKAQNKAREIIFL